MPFTRLRFVIPFYTEFDAVKPGLRSLKSSGLAFDYVPCQGPYVHSNRNNGVNDKRSDKTRQEPLEGYSHFLFQDSDMSSAPHHINIALRHNAPVVALPYLRHEADGTYQAGELDPDKPLIASYYSRGERGAKHVTFCGGGFLLVERHVFAELDYPWFHHSVLTVGENSYSVGEDVIFCSKLRAAGIPILMDFDYPVPHRPRRRTDFNVDL